MINISSLTKRIKSSGTGKRIAKGAFWSFTGTALAKFFVLVSGIICAHILTKEEYGEFGMVRSTINMFVVFGTAGIGLTASKFVSEYKVKHQERIPSIYLLTNGVALLLGICITILVLFLAPLLADNSLHAPYLTPTIRVGGILLFVTIINGAQTGSLSGFEDFKALSLNTLYGSIAESVLMIVGAYYYGVFGAVLGFGIGFIVILFANFISINRCFKQLDISVSYKSFRREDLSLLYKFSLPAALSSFMVSPTIWITKSLMVKISGFNELAVFEAADQWRIIIMFIPSAISQVVLPILSSMIEDDDRSFWKVLKVNLLLNAGVALFIAIIVSFASPYIIGLYGKSYSTDYWTLIILASSTVFSAIANVVGLAISSRSKMWIGLSFNCVWAIMIIVFSYVLMYNGMGARGLAFAFTSAYLIHSILQLLYLYFVVKRM